MDSNCWKVKSNIWLGQKKDIFFLKIGRNEEKQLFLNQIDQIVVYFTIIQFS